MTGQSILEDWPPRWGQAEERPRNTTSGPRTSPSLQENTSQELDVMNPKAGHR